jgi:hypothetical protein
METIECKRGYCINCADRKTKILWCDKCREIRVKNHGELSVSITEKYCIEQNSKSDDVENSAS